jgi:hypothetical protein
MKPGFRIRTTDEAAFCVFFGRTWNSLNLFHPAPVVRGIGIQWPLLGLQGLRQMKLEWRGMRRYFRNPLFLLVSTDLVLVSFDLLRTAQLLGT